MSIPVVEDFPQRILTSGQLVYNINHGSIMVSSGLSSWVEFQTSGVGILRPDDISHLLFWFDAAQETYAQAANVDTFTDFGPSGNDATQATSTDQPTFRRGVFFSADSLVGFSEYPRVNRAVFDFNGTSDNMDIGPLSNILDYTIFVVLNVNDYSQKALLGVNSANNRSLRFVNTGSVNLRLAGGGNAITLTTAHSINTVQAYTEDRDASATTRRAYFNFRNFNGIQSSDVSDSFSISVIGADGDGNGNFFDGGLAEMIFYAKLLTDDEREKIHRYLREKYDNYFFEQ
jgi:hypothetical protein